VAPPEHFDSVSPVGEAVTRFDAEFSADSDQVSIFYLDRISFIAIDIIMKISHCFETNSFIQYSDKANTK
jgi:hypothetical protein